MDREGDFFDVLGGTELEVGADGGDNAVFEARFYFRLLSNTVYKYLFTIHYGVKNRFVGCIFDGIHKVMPSLELYRVHLAFQRVHSQNNFIDIRSIR